MQRCEVCGKEMAKGLSFHMKTHKQRILKHQSEPSTYVYPMGFPPANGEKWTPPLISALATSPLETYYRKHVTYGAFKMSWKLILVIGIVFIFLLLFMTGRLPF